MKVAVFSDTHGNYAHVCTALDSLGDVGHIIHLGDTFDDAEMIEQIVGAPLIKVPGNCDSCASAPLEQLRSIAGRNFFIAHGDRYNVKDGLERLRIKAESVGADIVLFGHTHRPLAETIDGILFFNPGSLSDRCEVRSYGLLRISADSIQAEIIHFDNQQPQPQL
ncbi:MAG: metallophosphoesterase [Geobacter sp.]|nr:metallophosphoesterase [Geobacter sp.]